MDEPRQPRRRCSDRTEWWRALDADPRVTKTMHHVALALSTFGPAARLYPTMQTLCAATGRSATAVRDSRSALERLGYLDAVSIKVGRGTAPVYALALPVAEGNSPLAPSAVDNHPEGNSPLAPSGEKATVFEEKGNSPLVKRQQPAVAHTEVPKSTTSTEEAEMTWPPVDSQDARDLRENPPVQFETPLTQRCRDARPAGAALLRWTDEAVGQAREYALADGVLRSDVDDLLVMLASDAEVETPAAVRNGTLLRRAKQALRASRTAAPDLCSVCEDRLRRGEAPRWTENEAGDPIPCPTCSPRRAA